MKNSGWIYMRLHYHRMNFESEFLITTFLFSQLKQLAHSGRDMNV